MGNIMLSILGILICVVVLGIIGLLIMLLIWWMFHHNMDFGDLIKQEEKEERK